MNKILAAFLPTTMIMLLALFFATASYHLIHPAHAGSGNSAGSSLDSVGVLQSGQTSFVAAASAGQALPTNLSRKFLYIQNIGATNSVTCKFGATFTGTEGFTLAAGATFVPIPAITTSIWCKSASGTTVNFIEGIQ